MRRALLAAIVLAGCAPSDPPAACDALFGIPNEHTGVDDTQCRPTCGCGADEYVPRTWDAAALDGLRAYVLSAPFADLTSDPYADPTPPAPPPAGSVCAVVVDDLATRAYHVETFASEDAALAAGAHVTHAGTCGVCSTLQDLAVYAGITDLTAPVRQCGIDTVTSGIDADVACLEALGFTHPCAQIWAYDTAHTRAECGTICIRLLSAPYETPDGALNDCLQCDEDRSGPVFKAIAGRTRRNSGTPSALCRPCSEVPRIAHDYP